MGVLLISGVAIADGKQNLPHQHWLAGFEVGIRRDKNVTERAGDQLPTGTGHGRWIEDDARPGLLRQDPQHVGDGLTTPICVGSRGSTTDGK